ncbi:hypothetical protein FV226_15235 [Methylobacterium sp. WL12]|uniref:hypothetical protein n=1 Tax=Methylobacterium sp. WL12 TaxID=2603890 RepID=UPI0011C708B6|nr:hypothetical protein [Methylobacterium sp. WL12]TXM71416.1 hypothetical protein FV226_15235 [Methylobacterium sp. WL12]
MSSGLDMFSLGTVKLPEKTRHYDTHFEVGLRAPIDHRDINNAAESINLSVIALYAGDHWLNMQSIVKRDLAARTERYKPGVYRYTISHATPWLDAGRVVRTWLHLRLVVEEPGPAGHRGWRLLSHEQMFAGEGKGRNRRVIRIRGLPPEEQAARYALEARRAKCAATADRKAREAADKAIAVYVRSILDADPDFLIPASWAASGHIEDGYVGKRLDAAADVVRDAHHRLQLTRERLTIWGHALNCGLHDATVNRPAIIPLPGDDADALGTLI